MIEDHIKLDKQRKLLDCDLGYEKLRMVLGLYHYIYKIIEFIQNMYIKVYCITYRNNFYLKGLEMDISYWNYNYKMTTTTDKFENFTAYRVNKKMCSTILTNYFVMSKRAFSSKISKSAKPNKKINQPAADKSFKLNSPLFNALNILLRDNPINEETQIKIEKFLGDFSYISLSKSKPTKSSKNLSVDYSRFNDKLTKLLLDTKGSLIKLIRTYIKENKEEVLNKELAYVLKCLSTKTVPIMYGHLLKILSTFQKRDPKLNSVVTISYDLGNDLMNNFYYVMYLKEKQQRNRKKEDITKYYLSTWKKDNNDLFKKFEDNTVLFSFGSVLIGWLFTCNLLEKEIIIISKTEKVNIINPTPTLIKTIEGKNFQYILPQNLPMIVPPKPYSKVTLGGYLLNDEISLNTLIRKKRINKDVTLIKQDSIIYDIVNKISSTGYKINKVVLDFILNHSKDCLKDVIIDVDYKHPLLEKAKRTKKEQKELEAFLSQKELQENILGLATVFLNIPSFYIPMQCDFRGRLNCMPEYLNFQSNSLAKSLLLFSKSDKWNKNDHQAINYLKIYGAGCFGLGKKSAIERLNWVDSNLDNIINYENGVLVEKAKEKFLFVAFCVEYNRWLNCLNNHEVYEFETCLPVQLDATCNGFQHLALLCLDSSLGLELNLYESSWEDTPKDFYSFLITNLKDFFKTECNKPGLSIENKEAYTRLIQSSFNRNHVKKAIMTIPYNVSSFQLMVYIKESFVRIDKTEWFTMIGDNTSRLHISDFSLISDGLREVLGYKFPKLNLLLNYLKDLATVSTVLQIPIVWSLPSGLLVKQGYLEEEEVRIKPFYFDKSRYVLKILNRQNKYNMKKQIIAFMPNLVHSLDAASLALLLDSYFKYGLNNIFTVHDCFGVTANNVSSLLEILKLTYIKIYSKDTYLTKLDKGVREYIKNVYGDTCFNEETRVIKVNIENKDIEIEFPDIDVVLGHEPPLDLNKLKKSVYILN